MSSDYGMVRREEEGLIIIFDFSVVPIVLSSGTGKYHPTPLSQGHPLLMCRKGKWGYGSTSFFRRVFFMNVTVKLFGTLSDLFPDYDFEKGLELELPEGSKVGDLLTLLDISDDRGGTVLMDSRFLSKDERLLPGSQVLIFQALNGG